MFQMMQGITIFLLFLRFLEPFTEGMQMKKYLRFFGGVLICLMIVKMLRNEWGWKENVSFARLENQECEDDLFFEGEEKREKIIGDITKEQSEASEKAETKEEKNRIEIEAISW